MSENHVLEFHKNLGAHFKNVGGLEFVNDYGDVLAEYRALSQSSGMIDLSLRGRVCLTGADRARFLHGQVTNDVKALATGEGCYAALITAKGKMQSDLNIFALADELLLDFEPGLTAGIIERLEKFVIADDVAIIDVGPHYGLLHVSGPKAAEVVNRLGVFPRLPEKALSFVPVDDPSMGLIYLMNNSRIGVPGFDLFVPTPALAAVADKVIAAARDAGGGGCGWKAFEMARVEAGIPRFGIDMDETNIPLEAGLETRAISFNKGCYIGQEVISRIRTYGQVAKALRGLVLDPELKSLPAKGSKLYHVGKEVGYLTSTLKSPRLNANIALGYVRKEVNAIGTELFLEQNEIGAPARIVPLPFA